MSNDDGSEGKSKPDFSVGYDSSDPVIAKWVSIELNLNSIAINPQGTALVRGLLLELTNEIILIIKAKRKESQKSRLNAIVQNEGKSLLFVQ